VVFFSRGYHVHAALSNAHAQRPNGYYRTNRNATIGGILIT